MPTLLTRLDGVCLSGGPDLDPAAYGARAHAALGPTEPALDRFELELARAADAAGLPLLGVCRGAQALNVARGGTLHQHIDGHRQTELGDAARRTRCGSRRARAPRRLLGGHAAEVNSFHHQAVDTLGAGLVATAWAPRRHDRGRSRIRRTRSCSPCSGTPRRCSTTRGSSRCSPRSSRPPHGARAPPVRWLREHRRHRRADRHRRRAPGAARAGAARARRGGPRARGRVPLVARRRSPARASR